MVWSRRVTCERDGRESIATFSPLVGVGVVAAAAES